MIMTDLLTDLEAAEGLRLRAYQDTIGVWTVGYGHAHVAPGTAWTKDQAQAALIADVTRAVDLCDQHIAWWRTLSHARQQALCEMMFNMGWLSRDGLHGLGTFKNTLRLIEDGKFSAAAEALLTSHWAVQVGNRARRIADQIRTGVRA